jgi:gamma-glutamylcyclotransferase
MKRLEIKTTFKYYDQGIREWVEGEDRDSILDTLATYIGRIIIEFNSLEDDINWYIKEKLSHSEGEDETIFLILSKMGASDKIELLKKLYGQSIYRNYELNSFRVHLQSIEQKLNEAVKIRNRYAHTNWSEVFKGNIFKVKTEAKKDGIYHTFMNFEESHLKADLELIEKLHDELYEFVENLVNTMTTQSCRILVFSYGSNMYSKRLSIRVPSAKLVGIGKLIGYKTEFSKLSKDKSGKATLLRTDNKNDIVWGSISTILLEDKHLLDKAEGTGYHDKNIQLITETNEEIFAITYIADSETIDRNLLPYDWYKALILAGAKEVGLPAEYISQIESVEAKIDLDKERATKEWLILKK